MAKVQIMISTYNGAAYVREQLKSILRLSNADDISVLIRDDGSTDDTPSILAEYAEEYGFRVIYGENVGVNRSFQALFEAADDGCEFFAYCDQDDAWLPDKVARAVGVLEKADPAIPAMYASRAYLTDAEGTVIGATPKPRRAPSFYNAIVQNVCIGHTQVYNKEMLALLRRSYSPAIVVIDHWAYLLASAYGNVFFDNEPTSLYRQHGKNVIGYSRSALDTMKGRWKRARTGMGKRMAAQNKAFYAMHGATIPNADHAKELSRFLSHNTSFFRRLGYALHCRARRQTFTENVCFRLLYLFGGYRIG